MVGDLFSDAVTGKNGPAHILTRLWLSMRQTIGPPIESVCKTLAQVYGQKT